MGTPMRLKALGTLVRIAGATVVGTAVVIAVRDFADVPTQILVLGVFVSLLAGLMWELLSRPAVDPTRQRVCDRFLAGKVWELLNRKAVDPIKQIGLLETPFYLAHDQQIFQKYQAISRALLKTSQYSDPIHRDVILERLDDLCEDVEQLADGKITFEGTETWRIVYDKLLRSPGLYMYRSVAWIKHGNYWQDVPGRQSMALNFELHDAASLSVERIAIISDDLWPMEEALPTERVRQWIHEQHVHGIWIKLARQSAIESEPELLVDMGIYGHRAVGIQELDEQCRTVRFTLDFGIEEVKQAEERWKRLSVYAGSYGDLLDHFTLGE
jgi:hypothetical protein